MFVPLHSETLPLGSEPSPTQPDRPPFTAVLAPAPTMSPISASQVLPAQSTPFPHSYAPSRPSNLPPPKGRLPRSRVSLQVWVVKPHAANIGASVVPLTPVTATDADTPYQPPHGPKQSQPGAYPRTCTSPPASPLTTNLPDAPCPSSPTSPGRLSGSRRRVPKTRRGGQGPRIVPPARTETASEFTFPLGSHPPLRIGTRRFISEPSLPVPPCRRCHYATTGKAGPQACRSPREGHSCRTPHPRTYMPVVDAMSPTSGRNLQKG